MVTFSQRSSHQCKARDVSDSGVTHRSRLPPQSTRLTLGNEPLFPDAGHSLDHLTRADMENRFNADFSGVRIHADSAAARMTKTINAKAFTLGNHIAFGAGQLDANTRPGRSLLAHELAHVVQQHRQGQTRLARKVDVPGADGQLKLALLAKAQSQPDASICSALFQQQKQDKQDADPDRPRLSRAGAWADSPVSALLKIFNRLHFSALRHAGGLPEKPTRDLPEPPTGDVKLALDDAPKQAARRLIQLTAKDLGWNIEVMLPVMGRDIGRAALSKARREKRQSQLNLSIFEDVNAQKVKARNLRPMGNKPCEPIPAHRIRWHIGRDGLHIDAGGTGEEIARKNGGAYIGYPDANNLNVVSEESFGTGSDKSALKIPHFVCGNIMEPWPIGDNRADFITTHSAPINAKEIARVIKATGRVLVSGAQPNRDKTDILQQLANRRKQVGEINAHNYQDQPGSIFRLDIQLTDKQKDKKNSKDTR